MKLEEFKAWFQGYTEEMNGAPTKKQWDKIKKKVDEIDGTPVPVYINSYYPIYDWNRKYTFKADDSYTICTLNDSDKLTQLYTMGRNDYTTTC